VFWFKVAEGADRAGELADAEVFGGGVEAGEVALHLRVPEQQFEAEGGGFGVDAVVRPMMGVCLNSRRAFEGG